MELSLIHAGLAAGAALAALPVILHLFMRQKPKHVIFPALRLIRERQKRSRKKLRVKNWLLLLARMALLALMALALARPRIVTEASIGDQEVPTSIGLVFDTSLSMGYKQSDKTRLDEAKARALEILAKLPSSSVVYVVDSAEPGVPQGFSPAVARKRIEGLTLRDITRPLNAAVGQAYAAVAEVVDKPRHEVYVLTDLARSAWDMERPVEGLDKAQKVKTGVKTYVLRLTPRDVQNVGVVQAKPASDLVTEGEPVEIRAKLQSLGPVTSRVAELWLDGLAYPRDKKQVDINANGEADVRFMPLKLEGSQSLHQGYVRLTGKPDPLDFDDTRFFSFSVKPAASVLVVADSSADSRYIADAIDPNPSAVQPGTSRPFRADRITTSQFTEQSVNLSKRYRCVFLNNVSGLSEAEWGRLAGFVREGGGLVLGLGSRTRAESYLVPTSGQILPATLKQVRAPKDPTTFGEVKDNSHPLFTRYPKPLGEMLAQIPVSKYWEVTPQEGSRVLVSYFDKAPALIERVFKGSRTGRVMLWTTPLSRRPEPNSPDAWNEFPSTFLGWSFFYLMRQSVSYVAGTNEEGLNFEAGKDVILPIEPSRRYNNYIVQDPAKKSSDRLIPPEGSNLLVIAAQQRGNWTVKASSGDGKEETLGFSVNPPVAESQFVPLEATDLDTLFGGKDKYALADDPKSLEQVVIKARVGNELFPWMMLLIMIVVTLECVLANRFYREAAPPAPAPQAA
jgi:hypothetical protein